MENFNRNDLQNKTLAEFRPTVNAEQNQQQHSHVNFDYEEDESSSFFEKFKLIFPIILIAIVCFVAYAWYTDKFTISRDSGGQIPVIKASKEPLREKPEDPGGMKIVNRDKRVYDAISGKDDEKDTKAANILPAPEEPISHEEIIKDLKTSPEVINKIPATEAVPVDKDQAKTAPVAEPSIAQQPLENTVVNSVADKAVTAPIVKTENALPATAPTATETASKVIKPIAKTDTPVAPKATEKVKAVTAADITDVASAKEFTPPKKAVKTAQGYRVQLGSYRSAGDADASWITIKKKFPDILTDLNDYIEKADLGDKGIYYRLQLAGFQNESDARKVCQKLTSQKQGCFFVGK